MPSSAQQQLYRVQVEEEGLVVVHLGVYVAEAAGNDQAPLAARLVVNVAAGKVAMVLGGWLFNRHEIF